MRSEDFLRKGEKSGRNLLGVQSDRIGTGRADIAMLDYAISRMPTLSAVVELGTWKGFTSYYLGIVALLRGCNFHTFDIKDKRQGVIREKWLPHMFFNKEDVLAGSKAVIDLVKEPDSFVFIDNGNKVLEANTYARHFGDNSVMAIHDWGTEVEEGQVAEELEKRGFVKLYEDLCVGLGSACRFYKKTAK